MTKHQSIEEIKKLINEKYFPLKLTIKDDSNKHSGHYEDSKQDKLTHVRIIIHSKYFEKMKRIEKYRDVHDLLNNFLKSDLHSVSLKFLEE